MVDIDALAPMRQEDGALAPPRSHPRDRDRNRQVWAAILVAALFSGLVAWGWFGAAAVPEDQGPEGQLLSGLYDPPTRGVEVALNARDGQAFATMAVDPTLRQPELIRGGPGEQAYRDQRPLLGWLGWAGSGGQPAAAPWALVVICALSVVAMVGATAAAIGRAGGPPLAALVLLITPGVLTDLTFVGPEALGTLLLLVGLAAWSRSPRATVLAVGAFALAGLCRETMLLVPAALVGRELLGRRLRPASVLALSAAPYAAWVVTLRVVLGSWPVGTVDGRVSLVPFAGLAEEAAGWPPGEVAAIGLTVALGLAGLSWGRDPVLRAALLSQVLLMAVLGAPVWARSADVGRVLLPFAALGLVSVAPVLASAVTSRRTAAVAARTT